MRHDLATGEAIALWIFIALLISVAIGGALNASDNRKVPHNEDRKPRPPLLFGAARRWRRRGW